MKKWIVISFFALLLIYAGCAACVAFDLYNWDTYFKIVGVIGGLASIIGLGAAAFVRIDLLSYNAEAIERLATAAKEIENKESQIRDASNKIEALEYKKEELVVLVKKASLILYYKEELNRLYEKLLDLIHKNEELNKIVMTIPEMEGQLSKLEGEMETNPEIQDILGTIQKAKRHRRTEIVLDTFFGAISFRL